MGVLTGLAFTTVVNIGTSDPVLARRTKFVVAAEEQRLLVAAAQTGSTYSNQRGRAVRTWFYAMAGQWYVQPRYGARSLVLDGVHNAIVVDSLPAVDTALELLIEAARAGELDEALATASRRSKKTSA